MFGSKNVDVVGLIEDAPLTEDNNLVPVDDRRRHPCAYNAVKDILIVASAVRSSSVLASAGVPQNDARLHSLQEWGTAIGATKMCALLIARGFKNDNGKGPLSIPSKGTLARYVAEARQEVAAYVPEGFVLPVLRKRSCCVMANEKTAAKKAPAKKTAAIAAMKKTSAATVSATMEASIAVAMEEALKKRPLCRRIYVSPELLAAIIRHYPAVLTELWMLDMMLYLMYPQRIAKETGLALLSQDVVAQIVGLKSKDDHGFSAIHYIRSYIEKTGHSVKIKEYKRKEEARAVVALNLHPEVEAAYRADKAGLSPRRPRIDTRGEQWSLAVRDALAKAMLNDPKEEMDEAKEKRSLEDSVTEALTYLNSLAMDAFQDAVDRHGAQALVRARCYETEVQRNYAENALRSLFDQPKPIYKTTDRSTRLVGCGIGLVNIPRELRKIITQDWITFDLQAAHLAIIAWLWKLPLLTEFLKSGKSIWKELMTWLGTDNKSAIKHYAVYPLAYGAGIAGIKENLDASLYEGATERLQSHPLIQELLAARKIQLKRIKEEGGAKNAFDDWIVPPLEHEKYAHGNPDALNHRSVMAQVAQSYEFILLYPVFELAKQNDGVFEITLLQYDGFSVRFFDKRREAAWKPRIEKVVADAAARLGILTRLEQEAPYAGE